MKVIKTKRSEFNLNKTIGKIEDIYQNLTRSGPDSRSLFRARWPSYSIGLSLNNYGVREGALRRKYMLTYIFFVRPLLEHGVYEKVPYEKYMLTYIFFVRPLLEHGVYEKVPCAHACARLSRLSFRALLTSG